MVKVAIVGSQGKHWTPEQRKKVVRRIRDIFKKHAQRAFSETLDYPNPECPRYDDLARYTANWTSYVKLISGGCGCINKDIKQKFDGGVDVWAEIVADVLGVPKKVCYPSAFTRNCFEARNRAIAEDCDVLYCFDPSWRSWSGGQWTMRMAQRLGKEVHLELIE